MEIIQNFGHGMSLESIDQILANLRKDPHHYNHGCSEEEYMRMERMDEV